MVVCGILRFNESQCFYGGIGKNSEIEMRIL